MQPQIFMDVADLPWLNGQNVEPREETETGGKVLKNGVVMKASLIIEPPRRDFFGVRKTVDRGLIRHEHVTRGNHTACLDE